LSRAHVAVLTRAAGRQAGLAEQTRPHDERIQAKAPLFCSHTMRLPSFFPKQMVGVTIHPQSNLPVSFLRFRSAEPLASIWMQPCSVQMDPKEQCGFKIQVSGAVLPQPVGNLCLYTVVQVQTAKGARKKVLDESELVLQCESEAEREDWIRVLKLFATGP
jgi:hypothetical protein